MSLSVKDNENSRLVMRSEGEENPLLDSRSGNLKVATGTVITSEDQKHEELVIVEELIEEEKRSSDWIIKDPLNSISEDMNSLPKTNTCVGFRSPIASTVSEMTSNTVGYKNKADIVGTSMVDGNKMLVAKKDSLLINHSEESVASTI